MEHRQLRRQDTRKNPATGGILLIFTLLLALSPLRGDAQQIQGGQSGQLRVIVTGMESDSGNIRVALFNSEESYVNAKRPFRTAAVKAREKGAECFFEGLPHGTYAMRLYHDVNENGKFDRDARGVPMEPYAFSNNAKGTMGPAAWADAKFTVQSKHATQEISLD
jgi:uncharacterized protein (DUF2141 family)